jgi:hypothetical protein
MHGTLTADGVCDRVRFAKVGDHDLRQRIGFPVENLSLESGSFEKSPADLGNRIDCGTALECTRNPLAPNGMSESQRWSGIHRQSNPKSLCQWIS